MKALFYKAFDFFVNNQQHKINISDNSHLAYLKAQSYTIMKKETL